MTPPWLNKTALLLGLQRPPTRLPSTWARPAALEPQEHHAELGTAARSRGSSRAPAMPGLSPQAPHGTRHEGSSGPTQPLGRPRAALPACGPVLLPSPSPRGRPSPTPLLRIQKSEEVQRRATGMIHVERLP